MKQKRKTSMVMLTCLAAMWLSLPAMAQAAGATSDPLDTCNVVWDSPSLNAHGSMPLGNGDVGINAWVEPSGDLVFYVSKTDAWDENGRLCKIGRVRVKFDPPLPVKESFRQELKLREGVIEIKAGTSRLELWVDANQPVVGVEADVGNADQVVARKWSCGGCASDRSATRTTVIPAAD